MSYLVLGVAIFALFVGFIFSYRFLLFAIGRRTFDTLIHAFAYAGAGSAFSVLGLKLFTLSIELGVFA